MPSGELPISAFPGDDFAGEYAGHRQRGAVVGYHLLGNCHSQAAHKQESHLYLCCDCCDGMRWVGPCWGIRLKDVVLHRNQGFCYSNSGCELLCPKAPRVPVQPLILISPRP